MPQPYGIIVAGDPGFSPNVADFFGGNAVGLSTVSPGGTQGVSEFQSNPIGPFVYQNTLYAFLYDFTAGVIQAFASIDKGVTWAEKDSIHAPAFNQSATLAGGGNLSPSYAVCQNGATFYVVYYAGGATITTQVATLISFNAVTNTWGATLSSTLNLAAVADATVATSLQNALVFRPSDGSVFLIQLRNYGNQKLTLYYAQCFPSGAGWINVWNLIGPDISVSYINPIVSMSGAAAVLDSSGNICVFTFGNPTQTVGTIPLNIYFRRIHPDNTLGALQIVATPANAPSNSWIASASADSSGKVYITWAGNGVASSVYYAISSDSASWTGIVVFAASHPVWIDVAQVNGVVSAYAIASDFATVLSSPFPFTVNSTLAVTSAPVSSIWAAPVAGSMPMQVTLTFKGVRRIPC